MLTQEMDQDSLQTFVATDNNNNSMSIDGAVDFANTGQTPNTQLPPGAVKQEPTKQQQLDHIRKMKRQSQKVINLDSMEEIRSGDNDFIEDS